jgi:leucyl aminopeptidase
VYKTIRVPAAKPAKADTLVIGVFDAKDPPAGRLPALVGKLLERPEVKGDAGAVTIDYLKDGRRLVILGLGKESVDPRAQARTAGAKLVKAVCDCEAEVAEVLLPDADLFGPLAEGVGLGSFTFNEFKDAKAEGSLALTAAAAPARKAMRRGVGLAEASNFSRMMSTTPPNVATPAWMAKQARALARKTGMKCEVIQGKALADKKLIGLQTVGAASENKPCLIKITYQPRGAASKKPAVLLGKTITYDTGGLSLKINNGMRGMKYDKNGGCAVLGAMHAIANTIKPKRKVVALLVAAENSISDEAYRPDDIITYMNGVSVEVTNTDAEGRLVLADGLCWACKHEKPEFIIDMATLTGGVVIALGDACAGLWCDNDKLRARLEGAAEASGERLWRLPLWQDYKDMMKSDVADILNSHPARRHAHPIQGAAFLSYFVEEGIPWAHIDIAGTSAVDGPQGPYAKGPTGFGVRLVAEALA